MAMKYIQQIKLAVTTTKPFSPMEVVVGLEQIKASTKFQIIVYPKFIC